MLRVLLYTVYALAIIEWTADIGFCQDVGGFSKEIVLSVPWGTKPGEIGKIPDILDQTPGGPPSFDVDSENNIYLLDAGNTRVLIYNDAGEMINYFQLDDGYYYRFSLIEYIEDEGNIYIHDAIKRIFCIYTKHGEFVQSIKYNRSIGSKFTVENGMILGTAGSIPIRKVTDGSNIYNQPVMNNIEKEKLLSYGGKYTGTLYHHEIDTLKTGVERYTLIKRNKTTSAFEIHDVPLDYFTTFWFETPEGESVFTANPLDARHAIILKYDKNMKLVSKIDDPYLFDPNGYYVERASGISEDGDIYTLTLSDNGATITRYVF